MRILFFTPLPPPVHGVSYTNQRLIEKWKEKGELDIVPIQLNPRQSLDAIGKFGFQKIFSMFKLVFRAFRYSLKKYDRAYYCISTQGGALLRDMIIINLFLKKSKTILHVRGRDYVDYKGRGTWEKLLKRTFNVYAVIQHSELLKDDINWFKPDIEKRYYIPNGLDVQKGEPSRIPNTKPQLLFLSNMLKNKGPMVLVEALGILKQKGFSFDCKFVGAWFNDLTKEEFNEACEKLGIQEDVKYLGPKYDEEKFEILRSSDVLIFPTMRESFGNVLLEGMAFSLPVVASQEGAIPEIIENEKTGLLFEKGNAGQLADRLIWLMERPESIKAFGEAGRERYLNHFTLNHFSQNIKNALCEN